MHILKKSLLLGCILLCCIYLLHQYSRRPLYLHKETDISSIRTITITNVMNYIEQDDDITSVEVKDSTKIDSILSILKSNFFNKNLIFSKKDSLFQEDFLELKIYITYNTNDENKWHRDIIKITSTKMVFIICDNNLFNKEYNIKGTISQKNFEDFFKDMQSVLST